MNVFTMKTLIMSCFQSLELYRLPNRFLGGFFLYIKMYIEVLNYFRKSVCFDFWWAA